MRYSLKIFFKLSTLIIFATLFIIVNYYLNINFPQYFLILFDYEASLGESLTLLNYAIMVFLLGLTIIRENKDRVWPSLILFVWCTISYYEELSIKSDLLGEMNTQRELTIHNLLFLSKYSFDEIIYYFIPIGLILYMRCSKSCIKDIIVSKKIKVFQEIILSLIFILYIEAHFFNIYLSREQFEFFYSLFLLTYFLCELKANKSRTTLGIVSIVCCYLVFHISVTGISNGKSYAEIARETYQYLLKMDKPELTRNYFYFLKKITTKEDLRNDNQEFGLLYYSLSEMKYFRTKELKDIKANIKESIDGAIALASKRKIYYLLAYSYAERFNAKRIPEIKTMIEEEFNNAPSVCSDYLFYSIIYRELFTRKHIKKSICSSTPFSQLQDFMNKNQKRIKSSHISIINYEHLYKLSHIDRIYN